MQPVWGGSVARLYQLWEGAVHTSDVHLLERREGSREVLIWEARNQGAEEKL